jgi:type II secretory pathway pseudopilin PulG
MVSFIRKKYTFTELVIVITFFGILAAIVLPPLGIPGCGCSKEGRKTKAESDCKQIAMAFMAYKNDYGTLPFNEINAFSFDGKIMKILAGENPRNKVYFSSNGEITNPWGKQYTVYLDTDYNGVITTKFGEIASSVAVWTPTKGGDFAKSWE